MRTYALTENERQILQKYLESDLKLNGFSVLMLRLKRAKPELEKDLKLIKDVLEKEGKLNES